MNVKLFSSEVIATGKNTFLFDKTEIKKIRIGNCIRKSLITKVTFGFINYFSNIENKFIFKLLKKIAKTYPVFKVFAQESMDNN